MENLPELSTWDVILRVVAAGALGGLVGFEREISDQPAGFRTHMLVALGAMLFTLVGAYGIDAFLEAGNRRVTFDPTRVAAQVVTGIGFLGAGAIIRQGINIRGLTTAASLWVTAAIGVAVGLGYWVGAIATAGATVAALYGLKQMERFIFPRLKKGTYRFAIAIKPEFSLPHFTGMIEDSGGRIQGMRTVTHDDGSRSLIARVSFPLNVTPEEFGGQIEQLEGVTRVEWSR